MDKINKLIICMIFNTAVTIAKVSVKINTIFWKYSIVNQDKTYWNTRKLLYTILYYCNGGTVNFNKPINKTELTWEYKKNCKKLWVTQNGNKW